MQTQRTTTNTVSKTHQLHTGTIPMFLWLIISILPDDHQCALYTWRELCIIVLKLGSFRSNKTAVTLWYLLYPKTF